MLCCKKYAFPITGILKHLNNRVSKNFRSLRTVLQISHTSMSQNLTFPVTKFACNSPKKQYSKANLF